MKFYGGEEGKKIDSYQGEKSPGKESGNERSKLDGYPERQTKRAELCGAWEKVPHGSTDSKAVRGIAAEAGVHTDRTETDEAGCVQAVDRPVAGGGTILGGTDIEEAEGAGF